MKMFVRTCIGVGLLALVLAVVMLGGSDSERKIKTVYSNDSEILNEVLRKMPERLRHPTDDRYTDIREYSEDLFSSVNALKGKDVGTAVCFFISFKSFEEFEERWCVILKGAQEKVHCGGALLVSSNYIGSDVSGLTQEDQYVDFKAGIFGSFFSAYLVDNDTGNDELEKMIFKSRKSVVSHLSSRVNHTTSTNRVIRGQGNTWCRRLR